MTRDPICVPGSTYYALVSRDTQFPGRLGLSVGGGDRERPASRPARPAASLSWRLRAEALSKGRRLPDAGC